MSNLNDPLLTQPQVLRITGLAAATLQTWVNREHIKVPDQNPGRGKSRLYSRANCITGAILKRTDSLGLSLALGLDLSEAVLADFAGGKIPRDLCIYLDEQNAWLPTAALSSPRLYRYRWSNSEDRITVAKALKDSQYEPVIVFPVGRIVEKTIRLIREEIFSSPRESSV